MAEKNRVYYGEYTLKHWIDLILSEKIELPKYQRFFVWDKSQSLALVNALIDNQFVPPVTIGSYVEGDEKKNLILDGQQRLTSILLAYLDLFPQRDPNRVNINDVYLANENDEIEDDEIDFINWDFNKILELRAKGDREKIKLYQAAKAVGYEDMHSTITDDDFENCYLGFSFIVPDTQSSKEQQKFYSKVFRSINIEGKKLLPIESRAALYYLNKDLVGFFSPAFSERITLNDGKMDFVRYLSLLSQYLNSGIDKIARGYTKAMESYYENFIYAVVDDKKTKEFVQMSTVIPNLDFGTRMERLSNIVSGMNLIRDFESIIDLDMYMFGLIYHVLFNDKTINSDDFDDLNSKLEERINILKNDPVDTKISELHTKNPSALKHLRLRISGSIAVYGDYVS